MTAKIEGPSQENHFEDIVLEKWIEKEHQRQRQGIELIASENFVSSDILKAQGSVLTHKYAEGYPEKRYYGGCQYVDQIESLAIERLCELFHAPFANVQPHSGSGANQAVFLALLKPQDTILSMDLASGGHLSHGAKVSLTGKWFQIVHYGLHPETQRICFEEVRRLAHQHRPKMIIAGASAYPRIIDFQKFKEIADEVNAYLLADVAHIAGLIVSGEHPSPFPFADVVTSTTHKTLRGPRGGVILTQDEKRAQKINAAVFPGLQGGPLMHVIAAKAACFREALQPSFQQYAQQIIKNSHSLAKSLQSFGFSLVSGGTDNHLILLDFSKENFSGRQAQEILESAGITSNKNAIPLDQRSRIETSGLRIGTAAMTTRGFKENEFQQVATWIHQLLHENQTPSSILKQAQEMALSFPLFSS
jgi:glycine hydroxymethyltransferase